MAVSHSQQELTHNFFLSAVKLVTILSSFSCACIAGFYVHRFLLPIVHVTHPMLQLWSVLQAWPLTPPFRFVLLHGVIGALYCTSGTLWRCKGRHPDGTTMSETHDRNPDEPDGLSDGKRPEVESKSGKPFVRLARSKSDGIALRTRRMEYAASPQLKKVSTFELTSHSAPAVKRVVIVADPAEDEQPPAGSEEVDKKAEEFISRFYQNLRLQHRMG